jgi:hypothetical protein
MDISFFRELGLIVNAALAAQVLPHLTPSDRLRLKTAIEKLGEVTAQVASYIWEAEIDESREEYFRQTLKEQTAVIQAIIEKAEAL